MAIELFSENSGIAMSPRISFSCDLSQTDVVPDEQQQEYHNFRSNSSSSDIDFDFCVLESFELEYSSADELFSDGKILPLQIKRKTIPPPPPPPPPKSNDYPDFVENSKNVKHNSKSFWRFNRSLNLNSNCGGGGGGDDARTFCQLPILSRSYSTERSSITKGNQDHKQSFLSKNLLTRSIKQSQSSSSCSNLKAPLKKSNGRPYCGNAVRINKVLNLSMANLFGFGSIFFCVKDKNKKK